MSEMELEVFRAGDYGPKGTWSEEDLDRIAADYSAQTHEAPVTLDHAQRGPAFGWVAGLRRRGDRLLARLRDVSAELVGLVRSGAFKKRSVEIYRAIPQTGRPYLKALSFLGAAAPEVKGLSDPVFEDMADAVAFEDAFAAPDFFSVEPQDDPSPLSSARRGTVESFDTIAEALRREGRWNPAWDAMGLRDFYSALAAVDEVRTGPHQLVSPEAWFARFLQSQPVVVPMGEFAPGCAARFEATLPRGGSVAPESIELHRNAIALMAARPGLEYAEALIECARR